jgi:uncharacterized protein (TIGR03083 family)
MTSNDAMPELVRRERAAFIDTLETLTSEQWFTQSLCSEWRVVDVAAHLAWAPVLGAGAGMAAMVRNGFSMNRMIASSAVGWSARGQDAILAQLRLNLASGAKPIGMPTVAALADAVVHGIDVRRPLGLERPIPADVLGPVTEFSLGTPWPMNAVVGGSAKRRLAGVLLVATDVDWSHGAGPEVQATAETVARLVYGRPVSPDDLTGPGARVLLGRLGQAARAQ